MVKQQVATASNWCVKESTRERKENHEELNRIKSGGGRQPSGMLPDLNCVRKRDEGYVVDQAHGKTRKSKRKEV